MVKLVPMTDDEFQMYLQYAIQDYAQNHVTGGRWSEEEALHEAEQEYHNILPQGLQTPDHYLSMIEDEQQGKNVGILWFALRPHAGEQQAFVYDIKIFEEFRRRGYASQAFALLEKEARKLGTSSIGLHVFGHNLAARELYEKLGFETTNVIMRKKLDTSA